MAFSGLDPFKLTGIELTKNELGTGSYASVYELNYLGLKCAGKKLHESLLKQGGGTTYALRRFEEECRLLSQMRHPNIVQFLGVYFERGMQVPFLVMEFLPTTLSSCIEKNGILRSELSYSILYDIALGLNYLHSQVPPIIHRDLSSNNVLLTADIKAKISDLGVAKIVNLTPLQVSRMVHNTQAPGTPAYMPPEALVASPKYDKSIDIFSFGVMIIHIFSGKWPEPQEAQIRMDPDSDKMIPVSEAERREVFLKTVGDKHPIMNLIHQCISNSPKRRPNAREIVPQLKDMMTKNPPSYSNRLKMLQQIDIERSLIEQKVLLQTETLQSQIEMLQLELKAAKAKKEDNVTRSYSKEITGATEPAHEPQKGCLSVYCILMKDTPGEKPPGLLKKIFGITNNTLLLCGELLRSTPLSESQSRSDEVQPKYSLEKDSTVTLFAVEDDVSPLNIDEYHLLKAIEYPSDRFRVFSDPQWMKWGDSLKIGSLVYVCLPAPSASEPTWSIAIVLYRGPVKALSGTNFGVELNLWIPITVEKVLLMESFRIITTSLVKMTAVYLYHWINSVPMTPQLRMNDLVYHFKMKATNIMVDVEFIYQMIHHLNKLMRGQVHKNFYMEQQEPVQPIGSRIQVPTNLPAEPFRYGVIRWIGEQDMVAGIEMDEYMEGCTDGTLIPTGQKFFECMPGRGFYCPLASLQLDVRFMDPTSIVGTENPLDVPFNEEEDQFTEGRHEQIQRYIGQGKGIQGHQNSCYLDASIFGLFALTDAFDELFLKAESSITAGQNRQAIADLLWKGIVNPLRKNGVVRCESVMALRDKLDEFGEIEGITHAEKDPEEFLNMLFKHTLKVDPFITIRRPYGDEPEFFVELFVEYNESMKLPSIGSLLHTMFKEQKLSFLQVPSRLLIQVPQFGRQFKIYDKIIPDLKLSVTDLTDKYSKAAPRCFVCGARAEIAYEDCAVEGNMDGYLCSVCSGQFHTHPSRKDHDLVQNVGSGIEDSPIDLLSVICIETSHYVCFTKEPFEDPNKPPKWIFFDSMANRVYDRFNIPTVTECSDILNHWVYPANGDLSQLRNTAPRDLPEYVRRFTQDVYLCVYVNTDAILYGY